MHDANNLRRRILDGAYTLGIENSAGPLYKHLGLKKQTVDYALKKLKHEEFFLKTKYEIDLNVLGFDKFAWVMLGIDWANYAVEKFISKLLSMPQVLMVADVTGESDLAVKVFGPTRNNISAFILELEKLFSGTIIDTKVLYENMEYKRHYIRVESKPIYMPNKTDCIVLHEKMKSPECTLNDIAHRHRMHRNTVSNSWKKLWKKGVLIKELPDLTQKGYDEIQKGLKAVIIIKPVPGSEEKIIAALVKQKEIQDIFTTLSNEIVLVLRTENSRTLADAHRLLTRFDSTIRRTNTSIFLSKYNKTSLELGEMKMLLRSCKES
ncbi:Lrp/AsnC ligand binding domain protein [uncultured archaeon]|nr:Lrp/AsnC ligand binding domain protein [uncultured archaeon]